jgi:RNA polymerase sigma factor (sigma-70 family)
VNSLTDPQLLREYTERRSEAAFAELVRRHVDFVYSAALRMVRDAHLAEDVTQGVFVALAQNARQLAARPVLSGWLHRTAQNLAANAVRSDVRRRAREQEAAVMNELLATEPDAVWEHIAPHLDAALGDLSEPDRDAVLLRYFERKSAREIAQTLGTSEEAAQKRVSRAVERLREFFAKRGVTIGASGLAVAITANAVQAAPAGLAATLSIAGTGGTAVAAAKGSTLAKASGAAGLGGAIVGPVLGLLGGLFGVYMSIKNTKSYRERTFMIRAAWNCAGLVAVFGVVMVGIICSARVFMPNHLEWWIASLVTFTLFYCAVLLRLVLWTNRRQREIQIEDGTYVDPSAHPELVNRAPSRKAIYASLGGGIIGATAWLVIAAIRAGDWGGAGSVAAGAFAIFMVSTSMCVRRPQQYWSVATLVVAALGVATLVLVNLRWSAWFANDPELRGLPASVANGFVALLYLVLVVMFIARQRRRTRSK